MGKFIRIPVKATGVKCFVIRDKHIAKRNAKLPYRRKKR